jgi:hypothetical protein
VSADPGDPWWRTVPGTQAAQRESVDVVQVSTEVQPSIGVHAAQVSAGPFWRK